MALLSAKISCMNVSNYTRRGNGSQFVTFLAPDSATYQTIAWKLAICKERSETIASGVLITDFVKPSTINTLRNTQPTVVVTDAYITISAASANVMGNMNLV